LPAFRTLLTALAVAAASMTSLNASAEPRRTYSLEYSAPAACPDRFELVTQIERRSHVARLVAHDARFRLRVELTRAAEQTEGVFDLKEGGAQTRRTVHGESCARVVAALALMAAVAMDPNAETGPLEPEPKPAAPRPARPAPRARAPATARSRWQVQAGFVGGVTGGVAPSVVPFYGLWLGATPRDTNAWRPELRLAALIARDDAERATGSASFTWTAARAELCVPHVALSRDFEAAPCALADAGRVHGLGYDTANPETHNATWLALGLQAELDWSVEHSLLVSAQAGAVAPLKHDTFTLPNLTLHRIPDVAGFASLSLGVAW
jgi:hypothetical protein